MEESNTQRTGLNTLSGAIDRFEGSLAVIKLDDGQELNWPREKLPSGIKEGSIVRLFVSNSLTEEEERAKMAKNLLNEILKSQ